MFSRSCQAMKSAPYLVCLIIAVTQFYWITASDQNGDYGESKIVKLSQGLVRGYKNTEWGIFEFFGIPYATMPTGPNKFKAPLPAPAWLETFEAVNKDIACPQYLMKNHPLASLFADMTIIDDCLIANVFVPDTTETNLPVLVMVHGGAYQMGTGNLGTPRNLVKEGKIISISFNYRLGIHGFLCLGTEDIPGNAGMKDQVAALRWVQKNIASFGGNPNDVTIAGFSAGSSAVELLALSETTQGLFKRIIPESGAGVGVWSVQQDPLKNAKTFANRFNFESDDVFALEDFYKRTPIEELNIDNFLHEKDSTFFFVPCVERDTGSEVFLKQAPLTILKSGNIKKLPLLIGFANMEGLFRIENFDEWKDQMNDKFSEFLPGDLAFKTEKQKEEISKMIKEFYFGNKPINNNTMQGYINYFTDVLFAYPTIRSVRGQVEAGNDYVYLYEFSYSDDFTQAMTPYKVRGANHCAQTFTNFEISFLPFDDSSRSEEYKQFKVLMSKLWINFIKIGKPVPAVTDVFPGGWPASSPNGSPYMELNMPPELKGTLLEERVKFWDGIYGKFYSTPKPPPAPPVKRVDL